MIVVIGQPVLRLDTSGPSPVGRAAAIAVAAAAAGADVELIARVGDDAAGDALLQALSGLRVGHVAVLRDPARPTPIATDEREVAGERSASDEAAEDLLTAAGLAAEPGPEATAGAPGDDGRPGPIDAGLGALDAADVDLGLRYLDGVRAIIVTGPADDATARVVAEAAAYASAPVVSILDPGAAVPTALGDAIVLEAPAEDPEGAFARLVAGLAVELDRGVDPAAAFRAAVAADGWEATVGIGTPLGEPSA